MALYFIGLRCWKRGLGCRAWLNQGSVSSLRNLVEPPWPEREQERIGINSFKCCLKYLVYLSGFVQPNNELYHQDVLTSVTIFFSSVLQFLWAEANHGCCWCRCASSYFIRSAFPTVCHTGEQTRWSVVLLALSCMDPSGDCVFCTWLLPSPFKTLSWLILPLASWGQIMQGGVSNNPDFLKAHAWHLLDKT